MNQVEFESQYGRIREKDKLSLFEKSKLNFSCSTAWRSIQGCVPILHWLPNYSFRECFHGDLITGLTVGIMVVPQGMAYATLAGVDPVYGLYSCFFAAFIYMFFGTSRHVSIGTFAVASMMVATVHTQMLNDPARIENITLSKLNSSSDVTVAFGNDLTPMMITSALTFGVGICQLLMALCRLSFLTNYISDPLVSGFTTGAAVHVLFSQLDKAIGVKVPKHHGAGMIVKMAIGLIKAIPAQIYGHLA
uniref:SLC26A/SulP transporter domain-containing protein n=1 Tax=Ditylenchus dipsaci TaxID=166011 RepID=A0A915E6A2_9BILA